MNILEHPRVAVILARLQDRLDNAAYDYKRTNEFERALDRIEDVI